MVLLMMFLLLVFMLTHTLIHYRIKRIKTDSIKRLNEVIDEQSVQRSLLLDWSVTALTLIRDIREMIQHHG